MEWTHQGGAVVWIGKGDLTEERVDAIVNAANECLEHGGGVAAAIARKGGPTIQEESLALVRERGEIPTGKAVATGGGALQARWVIHAVGPVWGSGDEVRKLDAAVQSALSVAAELQATSIAMPAISTGIYGFPKPLAAATILAAIDGWLGVHRGAPVRRIRLVLFDEAAASVFEAAARALTSA